VPLRGTRGPGPQTQRLRSILTQALRTIDDPNARRLAPDAIRAARKTGIPASVLLALSGQESGYGVNTGPSSAGAQGVTQFIPSTRQSMIDKYGVDPWKNPKSGMLAAGLLLRDLGFKKDPQAALSGYSGGYDASAYNNPILSSARSFQALDRVAQTKAPVSGAGGGGQPFYKSYANFGLFNPDENTRLKFQRPFGRALTKLARASGDPIGFQSGFRTRAEQVAAYQDYLAGGTLAAKPGTSHHEFGAAADVTLTPEQRSMAGRFGLGFPVGGEPWHIELTGPKASKLRLGGSPPSTGSFSTGGGFGGGAGAPTGYVPSDFGGGPGAPTATGTPSQRRARRGGGGGGGLTDLAAALLPDQPSAIDEGAGGGEGEFYDALAGQRFRPRRRLFQFQG